MKNFVKDFIDKKNKQKTEKERLKNTKKYYEYLQYGALFLKFIYDDIEKMKKNKLNRKQRRRFEKYLQKNGRMSKEIMETYAKKIDEVINFMDKELRKKK